MNTFSPPKESFIENGKRYIWIRVDVMQHYGDKFLCSLKTKVPVEFVDFDIGWCIDLDYLDKDFLARYPHTVGRKDISFCVEDIQLIQPPYNCTTKPTRICAR